MALSSYVPRSHLRVMATRASHVATPSCEEQEAAVMMVDLVRFSGVSERLADEGALGAEKMSRLLDEYYGRVSDAVIGAGGDVIAFAGDGIVSMWPSAGNAREAVCAALGCADELVAQRFGREGLRARAAVSFGALRTYELGQGSRWTSLYAGPCVEELEVAAHAGAPGTVVLSSAARRVAGDRVRSCDADWGERFLGWTEAAPRVARVLDAPAASVSEAELRRFLPPAVNALHGSETHRAAWAAEFRNVSVVFVNLTDLDVDPVEALDALQAAFEVVERVVHQYQATTHQFLMDDNGVSAVVAFGLPGSLLERRQARALSAATRMAEELTRVSIPCSIGIASGRLFCGVCGNDRRRAYVMVGHAMNVAARLMQLRRHDVLCDAKTAAAARSQVRCASLGSLPLRGFREPIEVFRPQSFVASRRRFGRLVGRREELERIAQRLVASADQPPVMVEAPAGFGKSHLLAEVSVVAAGRGMRVLRGEGDEVRCTTAYFPWRALLVELLGVEAEGAPLGEALIAALADAPELAPWAPVLGAISPLGLDETSVTEQMGAAARADSIRRLMLHLLERAASAAPVVLLLDDVQWFDSVSLGLVRAVAEQAHSVTLVMGKRPALVEHGEVEEVVGCEPVVLAALPRATARRLMEQRLEGHDVPDPLEAFVWERAEGHPLHTEELVLALRAEGVVTLTDGTCHVVDDELLARASLPESIEGAITTRFDRVSASAQLVVRTAAVIGRHFDERMLLALFPGDDVGQLRAAIDELTERGVFLAHRAPDEISFRHIIMQEVVYRGLLFGQRRELHQRAAEWFERQHEGDVRGVLGLLAHHWEHAGEIPRTLDYLERAGDLALDTFSNREARLLFNRAIRLAANHTIAVGLERRASWLEKLGLANLMLTEIDTAGDLFIDSLELRHCHVPRTTGALLWQAAKEAGRQLGHRLVGLGIDHHDDARMRIEANAFGRLSEIAYFQNRPLELVHNCLRSLNAAEVAALPREMAHGYAGTAIMLVLLGLVDASRAYRERGVRLAREQLSPADAALAVQLACVHALSVGDWDVAEALGTEAEAINRRLGDRFRMQTCLVTLGFRWLFTGHLEEAEEVLTAATLSAGKGGAPQVLLWGYGGLIVAKLPGGHFDVPFLAELELLLQRHAETSSSEAILCHGLLALAFWRLDQRERALERAELVLSMLEADLPVTYWLVWGIAAVAEVFLARAREIGDRAGFFVRRAGRVARVLQQYAVMLPTARPSAYLMRGAVACVRGDRRRALSLWRRARAHGEARGMPIEAARARLASATLAQDERERAAARGELVNLGASWYAMEEHSGVPV